MRLTIVTALIAALALPASGATRFFETPQNQLKVVPLNDTDFEVIEAYGEGPRGIWCAAANYVDRWIPRARTGDLYVKTPRGPSVSGVGRIGVVFTISPDRLDATPFQSSSVGVRDVGQRLPVQHAYQFCRDNIIERSGIFFRSGRGHS